MNKILPYPTSDERRFVIKISLLFLLLSSFLSLGNSAATAENLLLNGSFEELDENGMPVGWATDAYIQDTGYTVFSVEHNNVQNGQNAASIRNIGENDARFSQRAEVKPDSLYRFSGYFRTLEVVGGRGANLSIEGLYVFSESLYDTVNEWTYLEWYGETGENQHSVTLYVRLGGYGGESVGQAWFDNICLEEVNEVPGDDVADLWYSQRTMGYYDDEEDGTAESAASAAWPRLIVLSLVYSLIAILVIQSVKRNGLFINKTGHRLSLIFWIGMVIAMILRMVLSYQIDGYAVDVNCFTSWGATMAQYGPLDFYQKSGFCDYPPAYTYILGLNALISQWIPGISKGWIQVIFRFFPSLCDIISCVVLNRFLKRRKQSFTDSERTAIVLLLAFNPVTILNSAAWGQMDSVFTLLLLLVAIWAIEGRWQLCIPCYMLAALVKPQALMLGFLGLCAIIFAWKRAPVSRKRILTGIAAAIGVFAIIVVPFGMREGKPFTWIIEQYAQTLSSYPYATVNTANFWYLAEGNWNKIENPARVWAVFALAFFTVLYAFWVYHRTQKEWKNAWIEPLLALLFALFFIVCGLTGASWGIVGTASMGLAFLIVLSLYIRKEKIDFLPYLGGLLFLLLYVFGVKMHERYVFPALLLLPLAYGIKRDRRILFIWLSITFTVFINEGIVLDNSIRLGSTMGHLNQDTSILAFIVAAVNCAITIYAAWLGIEMALSRSEQQPLKRIIREPEAAGRNLQWRKTDSIALTTIVIIYSAVSLLTLGSTRAPQTAWTSSDYPEAVILDLGEEQESFSVMYFARVSRYDFSVAVSNDLTNWEDETWAQMDQGQCWKWKYVTESVQAGDSRSYTNSRHWFSGRFVRITAHQINLALCEVIFRNASGEVLPVTVAGHMSGEKASPLYSDPANLIDEQNSFEGLPVLFSFSPDLVGEEMPTTAQPSWWNSTYFDEIYHARTAWEFLHAESPYETSHPPLGKVLMSWGIAIFGMTPFGWRFAGAIAGVLMLAAIYLICKQLTKDTRISIFASCLLALDCMHLTQTQIATIDSFPVLFILFAYFFMLRFLQSDWRSEKRSHVLFDLGCSGLFMGLSIASKWIGVYAGAGLAVLFFWHGFRIIMLEYREHRALDLLEPGKKISPNSTVWLVFLKICFWCLLFFVLVPGMIYSVSYVPYFASRHFNSLKDYFSALWTSQQSMLSYHSTPGLGMDHPFYSPWYEWPIIGKPMFYAAKSYIFNDELSYSIFCIGNPVIWWLAIPAVIIAVWLWIRNRTELLDAPEKPLPVSSALDTSLVFLLIGFLAQYLPWTLVPRGTYIYHYFASVPFLILIISILFHQIKLHSNLIGKITIMTVLAGALAAMILFFPYVTGIMAPVPWLDAGRNVLSIWY